MPFLYLAFALALFTGLGHSILSEQLFLRPLRAETTGTGVFASATAKKLAAAMFHLASVFWIGMALCILMLDPGSSGYRGILWLFAGAYALSGLGNFWAVGRPHMGGLLLFATSASILAALLT